MTNIINYTSELLRNIPVPSLCHRGKSAHSWHRQCQHAQKTLRYDNGIHKHHPYYHHSCTVNLNCLKTEAQVHKTAKNTLMLKAAGTHQIFV